MTRVSAHRVWLLLLVLLVQLSLAAGAVSAADPAAPGDNTPRDYIVVFKDWVNVDHETFGLERTFGFASKFRYSAALKGFAARLNPGVAQALTRLPFIHAVELDGTARITGDPLASGESAPTGIRRMGGSTTSVVHGAATVGVAVIDTGIDLDHPDLNRFDGTNCISPGSPANDDHGHGTHVAGTVAALNNGAGVVGVAPGTPVYAVKVLASNGSGSYAQIICGIDWVRANASSKNIRVANMSLGGGGAPSSLQTAIQNATNAGVTFVVAAGNDGRNFAGSWSSSASYPAAYTQVLTVTAVADSDGVGGGLGGSACNQTDDRYASFSNYSTSSTHNNHVIAAPGVCTYSTYPDGYATMSGTSMASPHVAGAVALCLTGGACVGQSPSQIIQTMRSTAATKRSATASYGFYGDPSNPYGSRYYGNMVWAGADLGSASVPADYSLSSNPTSRTVTQGSDATYTISVNPLNGFNSSVALSVSGLPSGATASFSPTSTTGSSTLTVNTASSATGGPVTLTIQGIGGGLTRTVGVSLTVNAAPTPDFSLSSNPTGRTVTQGQATSYAITLNPTGGFNGSVQLSTSALPNGVSASFTTNPTTGSSTLNITTAANATTGTATITVMGVSGSLTRTVQVSLTVNAAAAADFSLSATPTSQTVRRGTAVNYTITVNPSGGFTGNVSFSVSGLGSWMGGTFSPTSSTTSTTLRVTSSSWLSPRGTRTLTITGTSGGLSRTVQVALTLT